MSIMQHNIPKEAPVLCKLLNNSENIIINNLTPTSVAVQLYNN